MDRKPRTKETRSGDMQTVGNANTYVIARESNVVVIDFRRPDPPAPHFPGAGALRALQGIEEDPAAGSVSDAQSRRQTA
jgi:hypothetical protein